MLTRPQRLQRRMMLRFVPMMERWLGRKEATVPVRPGVLRAGLTSPERVNIMARSVQVPEMHAPPGFPKVMPQLIGSLRGIKASFDEIDDNPAQPRTTIEESEIAALERFARSAGALSIGYATVPPRLVFREKAVLYPNAVVLTMEMDKARIDTAPSKAAGLAVHETYNHLGQVSNKVARYLRDLGFATHAGHPLNGLALYPPLAAVAHLGGVRTARPAHHPGDGPNSPAGRGVHEHREPADPRGGQPARVGDRVLRALPALRPQVPGRRDLHRAHRAPRRTPDLCR
jgi:hypothetical protein